VIQNAANSYSQFMAPMCPSLFRSEPVSAGANFPASWENTGKFIDSGLGRPNFPPKSRVGSEPYSQIPYVAEQGNIVPEQGIKSAHQGSFHSDQARTEPFGLLPKFGTLNFAAHGLGSVR